VAYDIYQLENSYQNIGSGMVGELEKPISETEFLAFKVDFYGKSY
jgi:hypothetical protein